MLILIILFSCSAHAEWKFYAFEFEDAATNCPGIIVNGQTGESYVLVFPSEDSNYKQIAFQQIVYLKHKKETDD